MKDCRTKSFCMAHIAAMKRKQEYWKTKAKEKFLAEYFSRWKIQERS
ncbi:hypothetical protein [Anaerocellum danielii]|uniref:Uncharacterized protein n=1 Tax=Anaerocellum danielii TaxID=1387557 RepID=A0ABZ0U192_9FIRM|nr:hypothetical protein [Caldicellulosiruptor danielii]WPX08189.1 hypothetical protein SOJ16_002055 [Caldicellulosiruptor danielii]